MLRGSEAALARGLGGLLALAAVATAVLSTLGLPLRQVLELWRKPLPSPEQALSTATGPTGDAFGQLAWHFAYGVAEPNAKHTWFLLANPDSSPATATLRLFPDGGTPIEKRLTVEGNRRLAVYANSYLSGTFSATIVADRPIVAEESVFFANDAFTLPGVGAAATTWYFPEGFVGGNYETWLHVFNPSSQPASLSFLFLDERGNRAEKAATLSPGQVLRARLAELCPLQGGVGTVLRADRGVAAARITWFPGRDGGQGAHATVGLAALSQGWAVPYIAADETQDSWLLLLNPGEKEATGEITFFRMAESGPARSTLAFSLPAGARRTIWVDKEIAEGRVPAGARAALIVTSEPIAAECVLYDAPYRAGTAGLVAGAIARRWYFAEGATAAPYTMRIALFNPGPRGTLVSPRFLVASGQAPSYSGWALLPGEVKVVTVDDFAEGRSDLALSLESDEPIVAARIMSMAGSGLFAAVGLPGAEAVGEARAYVPLVFGPARVLPTPTATATPGPAASPTPVRRAESAFVLAEPITGTANCGSTGLKGRILDAQGNPLPGQRVRVWADGWAGGLSSPSDAQGRWDFLLGPGARAGTWFAAVSEEDGTLLSPIVRAPTASDCQNGHQWLELTWQRRAGAAPTFQLAWARRLSCAENHFMHNLFIAVTDGQGKGLNGIGLRVSWQGGYADLQTGTKPELGPGWAEFPMYGGTYSVQVLGNTSDTAAGLTVELPDETTCTNGGNTTKHYSYEVVFRGP